MSRPSTARRATTSFLFILLLLSSRAVLAEPSLSPPDVVLSGVPTQIAIESESVDASWRLRTPQGDLPPVERDGQWLFDGVVLDSSGTQTVTLIAGGETLASADIEVIPGWTAVLPPLIAIGLALLFRSVIPALFFGIWIGAWAVEGFSPLGVFTGVLASFQHYVLNAVADPDHAAVMLFSFMIGGMVGIVSRNGGVQALVNAIIWWARTPRRGQIATWALGLVVFFDDYANTLVVGNTARPVTDKLKISREKLAYIVDSTAAPVATIAVITTWVGYQLGLIRDGVRGLGIPGNEFEIFIQSIPYSFYPWLAIFFVFAVVWTGRDFGPMYRAELRARTTGQLTEPEADVPDAADDKALQPVDGQPLRPYNVWIPILVLVGGVFVGLWVTGREASPDGGAWDVIKNADSYRALMWASLAGVLVAAALSLGQRILTVHETIDAWFAGVKFMFFAMIVLVLAWSLSAVTVDLHTADYLVSVLGDSLNPALIPAVIFLLAAAVAFATGSSWGAMGILIPLVLPLTWAVMQSSGMTGPEHMHIFYSAVSCVLAGSVWGDHCSPIADTTILSS